VTKNGLKKIIILHSSYDIQSTLEFVEAKEEPKED
jgi:hypothetical protein